MKRTVTFTRAQIAEYAKASGDHNPIHLDDDFARTVGLPGVIAHGMLQMGIAATVAAEAAGGGERLRRLVCRFAGMVVPERRRHFHSRARPSEPPSSSHAVKENGEAVLTKSSAEYV